MIISEQQIMQLIDVAHYITSATECPSYGIKKMVVNLLDEITGQQSDELIEVKE